MLTDIRVLEISAANTMLAGSILGDLGADVVTLEPPAGSEGRRLEPFLEETPGIERSLTWHALNRNKRSITIDLTNPDGRDLLQQLLPKFDVCLEAITAEKNAPLDGLELPKELIRCSISRFARSGPKNSYASSDMVVMAATGAPAMTGEGDRPPLFFPVPQAMMEAGAEAAICALAGLAARNRDGLGQRGEVSARIAGMMGGFGQSITLASGNPEGRRTRGAGAMAIAGVEVPSIYECADGYALVSIAFGRAFGPMTQRLAQLAADEGCLDKSIAEVNWSSFIEDLRAQKSSPTQLKALVDGVRAFCRKKSKNEFAQSARKLGLLASSIMDMKDVAESEQFRERGLFADVSIGDKRIKAPARFAQFSNFQIDIRRPAPRLSQHTAAILASDLGLSATEIQALFVHGVI